MSQSDAVAASGKDDFIVNYDLSDGKAYTTYLARNADGSVDYNNSRTKTFDFSNNVYTQAKGRPAPNATTTPADGSASQYYYPLNMPVGTYNNYLSRPAIDKRIVGPIVSTSASQTVSTYGPISGTVPAGNATATGTQKDTAYCFHVAIDIDNPSSWGCGVTYGDSALQDMKYFAELNDSAIKSGGSSKTTVRK